jgi:hypothetical protein
MVSKFFTAFVLVFALGFAHAAEKSRVFFVEPKDGAEVKSPFKVKFGVEGMKIAKAGDMAANTGHHHLIVDGQALEKGQVVPTDDKHLHFGKGQTETELTLAPGPHTLTLQFADGSHKSYGPAMSSTIKVSVAPVENSPPTKK